jgi:hypothetical protein
VASVPIPWWLFFVLVVGLAVPVGLLLSLVGLGMVPGYRRCPGCQKQHWTPSSRIVVCDACEAVESARARRIVSEFGRAMRTLGWYPKGVPHRHPVGVTDRDIEIFRYGHPLNVPPDFLARGGRNEPRP